MLFKSAVNTQAFAKVGLLGFAGAGKTYTGTKFAIGLIQHMREKGLEIGSRPAYFLDTETGSDWVKPEFVKADIELMQAKTRAFSDLLTAVREAEKGASVLLIDSISHFWKELCDAYQKKRGRNRLEFQDWAVLKGEWAKFTDLFVNSNLHIILCGRAGYEYDYFEDDSGRKQLEKTGVKMKAETEMGYEPSLLVLMEREMDMEHKRVFRTAHILKDRSTTIDGKEFRNPTFANFLPHVEFLNLGGQQLGVDTGRNSEGLFDRDGNTEWKKAQLAKSVALDEIKEILNKHHGGTSNDAKAKKAELLDGTAGTRSWVKIEETYTLPQVIEIRDKLWLILEGMPYGAPALAAVDINEDAA